MKRGPNAIRLKPGEKQFLTKNFKRFTNQELLDHLNAQRSSDEQLKITWLRMKLYKMGLKKCEILRWTKDETQFLLDNYQHEGDAWIARQMTKKFRKFKLKNVEKKRELLGIKRTEEQIQAIKKKNIDRGCYNTVSEGRWKDGGAPEGHRVIWNQNGVLSEYVKVNGSYIPYAPWLYESHIAPIPEGCKVYHIDCNVLNNELHNLEIRMATGLDKKTRAEYARQNRLNHHKYKNRKSVPVQVQKIPEEPAAKLTDKIKVRINPKMEVYVAPGTPISEVYKKYAAYVR